MPKVVEKPFVFASPLGGGDVEAETMRVTGLRIFRAGTFTDMFGRESSWAPEDLDSIAANFANLRDRGIFPNVPMRIDHGFSARDIVGYFENVQHDPVDGFLKGDIQFVDPVEFEHYVNGKYRSRSIELGTYVTNTGVEMAPVMYGCAFVDIPAVEGLFSKPKEGQMSQQSGEPNGAPDQTVKPGDNDAPSVAPIPPAPAPAVPSADPNPAQPDPQGGSVGHPEGTPDETVPPAGGDAGQSTAPPSNMTTSQSAGGEMTKFKIGGAETTDMAAVQAHIDRLESENTVLTTTVETYTKATRESWVDGLFASQKIPAAQVEGLKAHVTTLAPAAFEAFKPLFDGMPANTLFAKHDVDGTGNTATEAPASGAVNQRSIDEGVIARLRMTGLLSEEQIQKTAEYKRLNPAAA